MDAKGGRRHVSTCQLKKQNEGMLRVLAMQVRAVWWVPLLVPGQGAAHQCWQVMDPVDRGVRPGRGLTLGQTQHG
ncbi:hypothetical protein ASPU41_16375 [Arthrobacter sp. U41]|nr:hypothetical protein ASPU41_16375 [Arthrobacter sp. U41]